MNSLASRTLLLAALAIAAGCPGSPDPEPPPTRCSGVVCDDGDACTTDSCDAAAGCQHAAVTCAAPPNGQCWDAPTCDPSAGCQQHQRAAGTSCSDTSACTAGDSCDVDGTCVPGAPLTCDDGTFCNGIESCDPGSGCVAGTPPSCGDGVTCTVDTCDESAKGCAHTPSDAACDDGTFCNGTESCDPGSGCVAGTPPSCGDGVTCTVDACDESAKACAHAPSDAACDDADACTADTCELTGCGHTPIGCDDGDACTADGCDAASGCTHTPLACDSTGACVGLPPCGVTIVASPAGGDHGTTAVDVTLTCSGGEPGDCDTIFYTAAGGAKRLYAGPIGIWRDTSLCFWAVSSTLTASTPACESYLVNTARYAEWDGGYGAPICRLPGTSCSTGDLVVGRDSVVGIEEPNQPNTIDGCEDGVNGTSYLDSFRLTATGGGPIREMAQVQVDAIAFTTRTSIDYYFTVYDAPDPTAPTWMNPWGRTRWGVYGLWFLSFNKYLTDYVGDFGAVRAAFTEVMASSCYSPPRADDFDDLLFALAPPLVGPYPPSLEILSPLESATVSRTVPIALDPDPAVTTDDAGILAVEFQANGTTIGLLKSPPWSMSWDASAFPLGPVAIQAIAYDAAGNAASRTVNITLE